MRTPTRSPPAKTYLIRATWLNGKHHVTATLAQIFYSEESAERTAKELRTAKPLNTYTVTEKT